MKLKRINKYSAVSAAVVIVAAAAVFCAFGVGEDDELAPEVTVAPVTQAAQTYAPATQAPTVAIPTEAATYAPATEAPTQAAQTYAPATEAPATHATYATVRMEETQLPSVERQTAPTAVRVDEKETEEKDDLTYGFVSWGCVIVGVLAVAVVLISNKTHYSSGSGKYRYDSGNMITGNKRLLDDDYYKNSKSNSYRRKDIRR